jgi:LacI family gluconate utilization system Gnt-I transcriptional repressor
MADVARHAGVSTMTVSRALKNEAQVSSPTRQKILRAVSELGYLLDQAAGSLSSRKTGFIAALVPSINNSNFSDTARGITDELGRTDLQLLLGYTDYSADSEEKLIEAMLRRRPEGAILTGGVHTPHTRRMLSSAGIPVIETWDLPSEPIDQVVGFSNEEAMRLLIATLGAKGYRRFGYVDGKGLPRRTASQGFHARAGRTWFCSWSDRLLGRPAYLDRAWRPGYRDPA